MERKKNGQPVQVWLSDDDRWRLRELALAEGKTQSALVRSAVKNMLDTQELARVAEIEREVSVSLKSIENRLASLIVKAAIDAGTVLHVLHERTDPKIRGPLFEAARAKAVQRLREREKMRQQSQPFT